MELTPNDRVRAVQKLIDVLFEHVLVDDEPIYISDDATLLDVSLLPPDELTERCGTYYRTHVSVADLRRPLWQLLPELEEKRRIAG